MESTDLPALRISRSWRWELIPGRPVKLGGGPPPKHLVPVDTLEMYVNGAWKAVPVVEQPRPEYPSAAGAREQSVQEVLQGITVR